MTIRVLHIFSPNYAHQFGGAVIRWKFYFSHWDNPGVKHYVLNTSQDKILDAKNAFDFTYIGNQREFSRRERLSWISALFINLYKYQGQYDVLHVHKLWWGGLLIGPWAKLRKIPAIYESVLFESDTPQGISKERFSRIKMSCLRTYSVILTVSDYLAEDYKLSGFRRERVITLLNCVDTELFSPVDGLQQKNFLREKMGLSIADKLILFVGTVVKRKGIDILVRAFIKASTYDPSLFLLIVGPVNKEQDPGVDVDLLELLEQELKACGLNSRYRFLGLVQDKQLLSGYYRVSDLFAFPSNKEGLPNALLEAMSSGLPSVVTKIPVLENTIVHLENGVFIPVGDVTALADAILLIANDIALANKLGRNARSHIQNIHSFSNWQDRIVDVYKELAKNNGSFT